MNDEILEELEKIRQRLTQIYHKHLGNPPNLFADMRLRDEIVTIRKIMGKEE